MKIAPFLTFSLNVLLACGHALLASPKAKPFNFGLLCASRRENWEELGGASQMAVACKNWEELGGASQMAVASKLTAENCLVTSKIRRFLKAGSANIFRMTHSFVGIGSLLFGFHHLLDVAFLNTFMKPLEISDVFMNGSVHVVVGLFGIRRLDLNSEYNAGRNAMIWPVPIQNLWLVAASLTEWGQGSEALFSMYERPFILLTILNICLTVWQLAEVSWKSGMDNTKDTIWFPEAWQNAIGVEVVYLFFVRVQMLALLCVWTQSTHQEVLAFTESFPEMQHILANAAMNTAFLNNLLVFLATLMRYKLVSKPSQHNIAVFSTSLIFAAFTAWKILAPFVAAHGGEMSSAFASLAGFGPVRVL